MGNQKKSYCCIDLYKKVLKIIIATNMDRNLGNYKQHSFKFLKIFVHSSIYYILKQ